MIHPSTRHKGQIWKGPPTFQRVGDGGGECIPVSEKIFFFSIGTMKRQQKIFKKATLALWNGNSEL